MRYHGFILFILLSTVCLAETEHSYVKTANFNFFNEPISIRYHDDLLGSLPKVFGNENIGQLTLPANVKRFEPTLKDLHTYRRELNLSDWLFYLLIKDCSEVIYNQENKDMQRILFCWLVMGNLDYKVQLNLNYENAYLSVFTLDRPYSIPVKRFGVGRMAVLNSNESSEDGTGMASQNFLATYRANQYIDGSKIFSFKMDRLPYLGNPIKHNKSVQFVHNNQMYSINYQTNSNVVQMLDSYPELGTQAYLNYPLSLEAYNSLLPNLQRYTDEMSEMETIRFLLSFTRQAFSYGKDIDHYNTDNRTFCAEQTLTHKYSDCEDRSILFAFLVNEILGREVIIVDFDKHVGVGIKLDKYIGKPILYQREYYTYCDPTGPSNDLEMGEYPDGLIQATYSIFKW